MKFLDVKNKYLYLILGIIILIIYGVVIVRLISSSKENGSKEAILVTPTPISQQDSVNPTSTIRSQPPVTTTLAVGIPGTFTIVFPAKINPTALTTTLVDSSLDPSSPTNTIPFTSTFSSDGKTLTLKTIDPITANKIYSVYVRLKTNNHIVVKERFQSTESEIIPLKS